MLLIDCISLHRASIHGNSGMKLTSVTGLCIQQVNVCWGACYSIPMYQSVRMDAFSNDAPPYIRLGCTS